MTYGLQIINGSGYTQIDDTYANFSLWSSGSASSWGSFTYSYGDEIYLIRLPYGGVFGYDDGWWSSNSTVEYRCYRPANAVGGAGTHGIRVYGSSGSLLFDANQRTMKIYSVQQLDTWTVAMNNAYIGSPTGERPWLEISCLGAHSIQNADGGIGNVGFYAGIVAYQNGDNSITFWGNEALGWGPGIDVWWGEGSRTYLMGD